MIKMRTILCVLGALVLLAGACGRDAALAQAAPEGSGIAEPSATAPAEPSSTSTRHSRRNRTRVRRTRTRAVRVARPVAATAGAAARVPAAAPVVSATTSPAPAPSPAAMPVAAAAVRPNAAAPAHAAPKPKPPVKDAEGTAPRTAATGPLAGTRSDPMEGTQESPAAAVGGAFRMVLYLVPVLALVVLGIRGLRGAQTRIGDMGALRFGGTPASDARVPGGKIRVLETSRLGPSLLHLVEVRGRVLLLSANGAVVTFLADVTNAADRDGSGEFRQVMNEAATGFGDAAGDGSTISGIVSSLDERMRDVRESVARSASRSRAYNGEAPGREAN